MHNTRLIEQVGRDTGEPDEWLELSQYWRAAYEASLPVRKRRERRVLALLKEHEFSTKDFGVSENGTCRVNPQARRLVGLDARAQRQ